MALPPLANLFAVRDDDPAVLEGIEARLKQSVEFTEVWRPTSGWVAAAAPLPGGEANGREVRAAGLAFAEGQDVVSPSNLQAVADLTEHHPDALAQLRGDFGFLRFHRNGAVTAVRSCGGLVPFYISEATRKRAAVATRLDYMARLLPEEPVMDPLANATWTTGHGFFPYSRSFLAGVSILGRGRYVRIEPNGRVTERVYWDPQPPEGMTPAPDPEHTERLRQLLVEKLERDLDPTGGNLLTLSGGVDSSALGALAAGTIGRPVASLSLLPSAPEPRARELHYIETLARSVRIEPRHSITLDPEKRLELLRNAPRVAFHVLHPALGALPEINRETPVRVLFGGELADEVCGSVFTFPDWARHTSLPALIASLGRLPNGPRDVLRWTKQRLLAVARRPALPFPSELPELIRPEVRREYSEWLADRRHEAVRDPRPLRHLALRSEVDGFVAMNWEAASSLGVRRSFPFFNREVLELAFACHPSELVGPGTKRLLRAALREHVPAENLNRPDKGRWGSDGDGPARPWNADLPEMLGAVIRTDWLPRSPSPVSYWDTFRLTELVAFSQVFVKQT